MKKNKTLTAVEWLIKVIDEQQKSYIDLAKKDKSLKKGVDAILTATTLLKMKCNQAKEMEKQQIIAAWIAGYNSRGNEDMIGGTGNEEYEYYNENYEI